MTSDLCLLISDLLPDTAGPSSKKIYQNKLRKIARIRKVSFAVCHGRHLLHKLYKIKVARQHEGIDHYTGLATGLDLFESLRHYKRVQACRKAGIMKVVEWWGRHSCRSQL